MTYKRLAPILRKQIKKKERLDEQTPQKKEKEPETQHKQGPDSLKKTEPQHHEANPGNTSGR